MVRGQRLSLSTSVTGTHPPKSRLSVWKAGFDYKFVPLDYWDGSEPPPSVTDTNTNTDPTVTTDPAGTDGTETTPSSADSSMSTGIVVGIVAGVVVVVGVVVAIILIKKRK